MATTKATQLIEQGFLAEADYHEGQAKQCDERGLHHAAQAHKRIAASKRAIVAQQREIRNEA